MAGMQDPASRPADLPGALVTRALLACLAALALVVATKFAIVVPRQEKRLLIDFDVFHLVGGMIRRGELDAAYAVETFHRVQRAASGADNFMPWTYPPPFDLVVAPLALLPLWLAYLVFAGATLTAYLLVLRRLAAESFGAALLVTAPALFVTLGCGQNGFLTGTLVGLACLAALRGGAAAGVPLGLMAIKPHLAVGLALNLLAARRWGAVLVAGATVLGLGGLATLAFGASVWGAFLGSVREARIFLEAGLYPMHRMVSVYAFLLSLGLPAKAALAAQGGVALAALAGIGIAMRRGMPPARTLGFSVLAGLMISPYAYDYDLPIAVVGLALLLPDLIRLTGPGERAALLALGWIAGGWGLVQTAIQWHRYGDAPTPAGAEPLSLGGAALAVILVMVWRVLERDRRGVAHPEAAALEPVAA